MEERSATPTRALVIAGVALVAAYFLLPKIIGILYLFKGPLILAAALGTIIWLHKRNFERRNQYGVEEYAGFGDAFKHKSVEAVVGFVAWLAAIGGFVLTIPLFFQLIR